MSIFSKVLRIGEGKRLKELQQLVDSVNALESEIEQLTDAELAAKTVEFRRRLADGETLDDLESEAFAVVREAAKRVLGQRHYDVQVIGAGAMHRHMIAEMRTGEGKTLVSTMPSYLNALAGNGVHIVTVNDYLASRDAEWMGSIHRFLGLSVGLIQSDMKPEERRPSYRADITYGTNNEFGFDYLRDNMAMRPDGRVQRGHAYAIIDEVDSILIDEARTPLIISGRVGETAKYYRDFARVASRLRRDEHYEVDEKKRQVITTELGVHRVEEMLGVENMYDFANVDLIHHLDVALKAKELYERDVEYLIKNGEIKIVDEFTGRVLEGRRYSEGLHQAIEAKEGVKIKEENQTLATITLQNYFRMYDKLAGMTGTALTEAGEFKEIYDLEVLEIPTNRPIARLDQPDVVYLNEDAKFDALVADIQERNEAGQPILVGTVSIEKSEKLASYLTKQGIRHEVLNAKQHEREAHIIAQAGKFRAVTVATNMAGRGVDIQLGGNPEELAKAELRREGIEADSDGYEEALAGAVARFKSEIDIEREKVLELGGLYVLGTGRHESRRIDNQLRGRSGRQGDPGESRFYLSLGDDLMRRFANDRVASIMQRLKIPEDVPIEHNMVTKAIERAQNQVEAQNFEIRKNVLKYDEVMNTQREIIYRWRNQVLDGEDTAALLAGWREEVVEDEVLAMTENLDPIDWEWDEFTVRMTQLYPTNITRDSFDRPNDLDQAEVIEAFQEEAAATYAAREAELGEEVIRQLERQVVLSIIDNKWRDHLAVMDYLRAGIGLRAMGQRDPLTEYQREGYDLFSTLVSSTKADALRYLYHVEVVRKEDAPRPKAIQTNAPNATAKPRTVKVGDKVGRNAPCPCGSGKKYKQCHGRPGAEPL
ncbi:MAG TPA: preprotein translocase subunit SecA [Acidimicrobiia bacterium]|jgi:preprotein translocase subunit SecA|nr:preprotein translocase subunit SecA [Acidimicrobiia bacterium]